MPSNSTNKCPECKHEVLVHGSGSSTHTHCGDSLGYELICSCPFCKGTGLAPEPTPDDIQTLITKSQIEVLEKVVALHLYRGYEISRMSVYVVPKEAIDSKLTELKGKL